YLQTEGNMDYRECKIAYYTYSMFETPSKFRVNVNVHIQSPKSQYKKTLTIDDSFDSESEAINYGIEQGKKYIDQNYESGKISFITSDTKRDNPLQKQNLTATKPQAEKKKDQK